MRLIVTGSIAYDYLMKFPGSFAEEILPEHLNRLSVSFLVESMEKRRGGCAPNIAYTLALLGERPVLMATAGHDFTDYAIWLEKAGIDVSLVQVDPGKFTASFFGMFDGGNRQIASFYTGAMANAAELSFRTAGDCDLTIIAPNDPKAMIQYAEECRVMGLRFIADPGQQCAWMSGDDLRNSITGAYVVICNDYEIEVIREKTGLGVDDLLKTCTAVVVTRGEHGSRIYADGKTIDVAAVTPHRIVDPTGVGDAFRGGLMKGLAANAGWETSARLGSVAATYALEHLGGQSHAFTWAEFSARYAEHFGALSLPPAGRA
jgi:adenosine kinase